MFTAEQEIPLSSCSGSLEKAINQGIEKIQMDQVGGKLERCPVLLLCNMTTSSSLLLSSGMLLYSYLFEMHSKEAITLRAHGHFNDIP